METEIYTYFVLCFFFLLFTHSPIPFSSLSSLFMTIFKKNIKYYKKGSEKKNTSLYFMISMKFYQSFVTLILIFGAQTVEIYTTFSWLQDFFFRHPTFTPSPLTLMEASRDGGKSFFASSHKNVMNSIKCLLSSNYEFWLCIFKNPNMS